MANIVYCTIEDGKRALNSAMLKSAALEKAQESKAPITLKKAPWEK